MRLFVTNIYKKVIKILDTVCFLIYNIPTLYLKNIENKLKTNLQYDNSIGEIIYQFNSFFLSVDKVPITETAFQNVLFRIKNRLGLQKLNPHYLRHTFATRYIINGGDMSTLQMIMGHDDVHLANYYMKMDFET